MAAWKTEHNEEGSFTRRLVFGRPATPELTAPPETLTRPRAGKRTAKRRDDGDQTPADYPDWEWLRMDLPIHDPKGVARALQRALGTWGREDDEYGSAFYLKWSEKAGLESAIGWQKPPTRGAEAQFVPKMQKQGAFGTSMTELLREAATHIGVAFPSLYRLAFGKGQKAVRWSTVYRLQKVMAREHPTAWRELEVHLLSPTIRRLKREYEAYIERERRRMRGHRTTAKHGFPYSPQERHGVERALGQASRLGLPATRADLAILRAANVIVGWRPLREQRQRATRSALFTAALRVEGNAMRAEAALLKAAFKETRRRGFTDAERRQREKVEAWLSEQRAARVRPLAHDFRDPLAD